MMNVSVLFEETPTSLRISAPISPAASARPTPIITTRMIATAAKFRKFVDERREQEADAVAGQQALDLGRLRRDLVGLRRLGLGRPDVGRLGRAAVVGLLGRRPAGGLTTWYVALTSNQ